MNSTLSPPAKARITRELSLLSTNPPPGVCCYCPTDNLTYLHASITGPPSTPFESGIFLLSINIPNRYPFEPPRIRFHTKIHHPNIDQTGRICLDTLKSPPSGSWSPAVSLPSLLVTLQSLMAEPNGDDGLVAETTNQFRTDYQAWYDQARKLTMLEATYEKMIEIESSIKTDLTERTEDTKKSVTRYYTCTGKENESVRHSNSFKDEESHIDESSLGKRSRDSDVESVDKHSTTFSRLKKR